ncbi:hypothetical protein FRC00_007238 [Tulasnella sp. 408]|nr:hypothetical protein FRC00_007238 [Tulasnella sp. 408]
MKPTRKSSSSSDAPVADDMIRLNFSRNSVYNTIISSEDNEIMYEVSTPNIWSFTKSVTTVMKLDKTSEQKMFVGEIGWRGLHHRIVVRIGSQNIEWLLAKVWLTNSKGISTAKTFDASQGVRYRWKTRKLEYHARPLLALHDTVTFSILTFVAAANGP